MNIEHFLSTGDGKTMTPQQAAELNAALATASTSDIPADRRSDVVNYVLTALNVNSVHPDLVSLLDSLVETLQSPSLTQE